MHRPASAEQKSTCSVRTAAGSQADAVVSLVGPLALPESVFRIDDLSHAGSVPLGPSRLVAAVSIPSSPPPRA